MADYERILLAKQEVFVYQIPPRTTARGYKASDWNLAAPTWTVRMRLITKGDGKLVVRLEDKISGQLFAQSPIDTYPSTAVEPVSDSSRYFVLRVLNDQTGKQAFLGLGFGDRSDSFDFNVALQDFFKEKQTEELIQKEAQRDEKEQKPKLDLGFKEGQTITLSIAGRGGETGVRSRPRAANSAAGAAPLLPPPPSAGNTRRGRSPAPNNNRSMQPQQQSPETEHAGGGSTDSSNFTASNTITSMPKMPLPQQPQQQQQPSTNQDILSLFG